MSTNWRIQTILIDQSETVDLTISNMVGTVIRSRKGTETLTRIPKGSESLIVDLYGKPSNNWPDVWDLIQANKSATCWVSAPSLNGLYSGVFVTKTGTESMVSGVTSISSINYSDITWKETAFTGDGLTANFNFILSDFSNYIDQSIDILVDGVSITVSATDTEPEVLTAVPDVGTGTYTRATGVLDFTFDVAPILGSIVESEYHVDRSQDVYFSIFNASPQIDDKAIIVIEDNEIYTLDFYLKSGSDYSQLAGSPIQISLTEGTKDDNGKNIYIKDVFSDLLLFDYSVNTSLVYTTFTDDTSQIDFVGGYRGEAITATELALGWNQFQNKNTYECNLFYETTADTSIPAIFETLRNTYQTRAHYILPLPQEDGLSAISTKAGYSISDRGISYYWNYGIVTDTYNNSRLTSPLIGKVVQKFAAMSDIYNGLQPMWEDENNHGGQLGGGIEEMLFDADEDLLKAMDDGRVNPIVFDNNLGFVIKSGRTSLTKNSDYRSIGHSRLADFIIEIIEKQILPSQIGKLNDNVHRTSIKNRTEQILDPITSAPFNLLREFFVQCDENNNTDDVMSREEFHLLVKIKFTKFSEFIKLFFINTPQNVSVEESF